MNLAEFNRVRAGCDEVLGKKLFFISGAPKSGTTWVQKALDAHSEIACAGEGHFFDGFGGLLSQALDIYNNKLLAKVAEEVYEGRPYYEKIGENDLKFLIINFVSLMLSKRQTGKNVRYLGDKTPANALVMECIHSVFPEAKFIHLYRDGRDVVVSTYKHALRVKQNPAPFGSYIEEIAKKWVEFNRDAMDFGKKHEDLFLPIYYKDLSENFTPSFSRILEFLGADDSEKSVNLCCEAASFEKLSGGRKPGQENSGSFYRKGIPGDWKNYFSRKDLELFNRIGGNMLEELGFGGDACADSEDDIFKINLQRKSGYNTELASYL